MELAKEMAAKATRRKEWVSMFSRVAESHQAILALERREVGGDRKKSFHAKNTAGRIASVNVWRSEHSST